MRNERGMPVGTGGFQVFNTEKQGETGRALRQPVVLLYDWVGQWQRVYYYLAHRAKRVPGAFVPFQFLCVKIL
jgi:hypothetical protein